MSPFTAAASQQLCPMATKLHRLCLRVEKQVLEASLISKRSSMHRSKSLYFSMSRMLPRRFVHWLWTMKESKTFLSALLLLLSPLLLRLPRRLHLPKQSTSRATGAPPSPTASRPVRASWSARLPCVSKFSSHRMAGKRKLLALSHAFSGGTSARQRQRIACPGSSGALRHVNTFPFSSAWVLRVRESIRAPHIKAFTPAD